MVPLAGSRQLFLGDVQSGIAKFRRLFLFFLDEVVLSPNRVALDGLPAQARENVLGVVAAYVSYYSPPDVRCWTSPLFTPLQPTPFSLHARAHTHVQNLRLGVGLAGLPLLLSHPPLHPACAPVHILSYPRWPLVCMSALRTVASAQLSSTFRLLSLPATTTPRVLLDVHARCCTHCP